MLSATLPRRLCSQTIFRPSIRRSFTATATRHHPDPPKNTSVVGSFLFKHDGQPTSSPQVALFRRSGINKTYAHKLGPIAGKLEATDESPLAGALREIHEETALTTEHLRLICKGTPYSFVDQDVQRQWTLYPFAFALKHDKVEDSIKLCPENESWEWFNARDVAAERCVPKMLESLRRVWPLHATRDGLPDVQLERYCFNSHNKDIQLQDIKDLFLQSLAHVDPTLHPSVRTRAATTIAWHILQSTPIALHPTILEYLTSVPPRVSQDTPPHALTQAKLFEPLWKDLTY